ncbi:hypothetical protein SV7mr_27510 [Stieleria bergensis]|uniref:Tetratricopeptide repeat protein n=1 Tax=Stieleria bergensis TaxID=2528025 RepID=A0A517SVT8_9BACT|nr:hypothetical protein SV7mr_27510 [Planctomycetes bacterium SV_7m_r]
MKSNYYNPLVWMAWCRDCAVAWFSTIPWGDAPKAIPALLLTLILFIIGFVAFSQGTGWRQRLLDRQYAVAMELDDFPTAEIVVRRQLETQPTDVRLQLKFALLRDHQGFSKEADAVMVQLLDRHQRPAAQWLLDKRFVNRKFTDMTEEELQLIEKVLLLLESEAQDDGEQFRIRRVLADYYRFRKRPRDAIPILLSLARSEPAVGLEAAYVARGIGEIEDAKRYAKEALGGTRIQFEQDPGNASLAYHIALNRVFLEQFSDAITVLHTAMANVSGPNADKNHARLAQALGTTIVSYIQYIEASPQDTRKERIRILRMLEGAAEIAPNNSRVLTMLSQQILKSLDDNSQEAIDIRESLLNDQASKLAHFIRGTAALLNDDLDEASLHLHLAKDEMRDSPAVLNNLAVVLTRQAVELRKDNGSLPEAEQSPEWQAEYDLLLKRALKLVNQAIKDVDRPTPHFFETQGHTLFLMGRQREAIISLEHACKVPALALRAHRMLAVCYRNLGDPALAADHDRAANLLEDKAGNVLPKGGVLKPTAQQSDLDPAAESVE